MATGERLLAYTLKQFALQTRLERETRKFEF